MLETADEPATDEPVTIESLAAARRQRLAATPAVPTLDAYSPSTPSPADSQAAAAASLSSTYPPSSPSSSTTQSQNSSTAPDAAASPTPAEASDLESEADSQGAFNEETGEINWDCPCLGGMAHGSCGTEFRDAFSCFVYSTDEPKGINCIEKFKFMQDCFRKYPEVYGSELTDPDPGDDEAMSGEMGTPGTSAPESAPVHMDATTESSPGAPQVATTRQPEVEAKSVVEPPAAPYSGSTTPAESAPGANLTSTPSATPISLSGSTGISENAKSKDDEFRARSGAEEKERSRRAAAQVRQVEAQDESEALVPKAAHDTTEARRSR
ncbi:MAG: hypothetical protein Q9162_005842 [Coniocarpon cinnabarinum]